MTKKQDFSNSTILNDVLNQAAPAKAQETKPAAKTTKQPVKRENKSSNRRKTSISRSTKSTKPVIERRSQRRQLLLTKSINEGLEELAAATGQSVNQIANDVFAAYIKKELVKPEIKKLVDKTRQIKRLQAKAKKNK